MDQLFLLHTVLHLLLWTEVHASQNGCNHPCLLEGSCKMKKLFNNCYYNFIDELRSWNETNHLCHSRDLNMVKLSKDLIKNGSLQHLAKDFQSSDAWLGGRVQSLEKWTYVNGVPHDEVAFQLPEKFYRGSTQMCGILGVNQDSSRIYLDLDLCYNNNLFMCRSDDTVMGDPCFHIPVKSSNWFEARSICMDFGGDLFFLEKDEKISNMRGKLALFKNMKFFIGLRRQVWEWEDGEEILHFNWKEREPNANDENCLTIYKDGKWNDMRCSSDKFAFCQKEVKTVSFTSTDRIHDNKSAKATGGVTMHILTSSLVVAILIIIALIV